MDASRFNVDGSVTQWLSVGVQLTGECTAHAALLYREDDDLPLCVVHMCWHRHFRGEPYTGEFGCASLKIRQSEELWLSGFCGRILKTHRRGEIPFSIRHEPDVAFDKETGRISFPNSVAGLNCSNFVAAFFRSSGTPLIDVAKGDWPTERPDDIVAQTSHVQMLLDSDDPEFQARGKQIQGDIGCSRIRPEEIAGACLEDEYPVAFAFCEANGQFIRNQLSQEVD